MGIDFGEVNFIFYLRAYAKLYGSYDKIEIGYSAHAFRDLTGGSA